MERAATLGVAHAAAARAHRHAAHPGRSRGPVTEAANAAAENGKAGLAIPGATAVVNRIPLARRSRAGTAPRSTTVVPRPTAANTACRTGPPTTVARVMTASTATRG